LLKKLSLVFVLALIVGLLAGCGGNGEYQDGTYQASAMGYHDEVPIELEVVISGGSIEEINILDHAETDGIADSAFEDVIPQIIETQSTDVDTLSGATITSEAIIEAVEKALEKAQ